MVSDYSIFSRKRDSVHHNHSECSWLFGKNRFVFWEYGRMCFGLVLGDFQDRIKYKQCRVLGSWLMRKTSIEGRLVTKIKPTRLIVVNKRKEIIN